MNLPKIWLISSYRKTLNQSIRKNWHLLLSRFREGSLYYQSPSYFDHLGAHTSDDELFLAIAECKYGELTGIVPLLKTRSTLDFRIHGRRIGYLSFSSVRIYGNNLLFPPSPVQFEALFGQLDASLPDCDAIEVVGILTTSTLWVYLKECQSLQHKFMLYAPNGIRWCHTLDVPESYEVYLAGFKRKKRYNLMRQVRRLQQWGEGTLTLCCVQAALEVPILLGAITILVSHSDRFTHIPRDEEILDLAQRGLLMGYVLSIRNRPCAMAFGTTFNNELLIHCFAHDKQLNHFSPGSVLDMLLIQNLIESKLIRRIDYGFGEPRFRLTNNLDQRVTILLLRKNALNKLAVMLHASFRYLLNWIKLLLKIRGCNIFDSNERYDEQLIESEINIFNPIFAKHSGRPPNR